MSRKRSLLALALTLVVVAWLTRETFEARAGSSRQTWLAFGVTAALLAGAYVSGGWPKAHRGRRRPVAGPALTGIALFAAFAVMGEVADWIGPLGRDVDALVAHARAGGTLRVVLVAASAAAAEEVFYRGALFERVRLPMLTTTVLHMLTTLPTANAALTLAAGTLGLVLGLSRRVSGGWYAPAVTHVVWSLLVVALLPT